MMILTKTNFLEMSVNLLCPTVPFQIDKCLLIMFFFLEQNSIHIMKFVVTKLMFYSKNFPLQFLRLVNRVHMYLQDTNIIN